MDFLEDNVNVEFEITEDIVPLPTIQKRINIMQQEESIELKTESDPNETAANVEMEESSTKVSFSCVKCEYIGDCFEDLRQHINRKHSMKNVEKGADGKYKCEDCDNVYFKRLSLLKHSKQHTGLVYNCSQCSYTSWSKNYLKKHMNKEHSEGPTKCSQCGYVGYSIEDLSLHKTRKHVLRNIKKDTDGLYRCKHCDYETPKKNPLHQHLKIHEGIIHKCSKCEYTCFTDLHLSSHMKRVHGEAHLCDECSCSFRDRYELKRHKSSKHTQHTTQQKSDGEIYKCDQCTYSSPWPAYLRKHIRRIHLKNYRKHFCDQCPSSFKEQRYLRKHIERMHVKIL